MREEPSEEKENEREREKVIVRVKPLVKVPSQDKIFKASIARKKLHPWYSAWLRQRSVLLRQG